MKPFAATSLATVCLFVSACANAPLMPEKGHPDSTAKGWVPLIADDLSNTNLADAADKGKAWVLEAPGTFRSDIDRMVFTKEAYENYILDLEFKLAPGTNGGVILYCSDTNNWIPNSIEVQVADDSDPKWSAKPDTRCGAFYGRQKPSQFVVKKPGEWNRYTITCIGTNVTVRLNGEEVNRFDLLHFKDAKKNPDGTEAPPWLSKAPAGLPAKGCIGFQGKHGAAPVWYRNIRIRLLSAEEVKAMQPK